MRLGEFRRVQFSGILGEYFQGVSISQPLFSCFLAFYEYIFSFYASVFKLIAEGRRAPCDSFHGVTSLPWVVAHTVPNLLTDVSVLGLSCFCVWGALLGSSPSSPSLESGLFHLPSCASPGRSPLSAYPALVESLHTAQTRKHWQLARTTGAFIYIMLYCYLLNNILFLKPNFV